MDNSDRVGSGQGTGDLGSDGYRFLRWKRTLFRIDPLAKRVSLQQLHDVVQRSIGKLSKVRDLDEPTVTDDVDGARFV
jgi:hypothetical protein